MKLKSLSLLAALALAPSAADAAGFAIDTQGGKATGLATAVTSHIDDPSAIFYNPAGLTEVHDFTVVLGVTPILPTLQFTGEGTNKTTTNKFGISPPPHLYASMKLSEKVAAGLGIYTPYGASANWPEDWDYRHRSLRSQVATYYINPTLAWSPVSNVRLGVGLQLVRGSVTIEKGLNFVESEGKVVLNGGGWGGGINAGIQVDLLQKKLQLGASFRSHSVIRFNGTATFVDTPAELRNTLRDQTITSELTTPDTAFLGVSYRVTPKLLLAADINWYRWSNVPAIVFDFQDDVLDQTVPKRWKDVANYHVGAEYKASDALALRLGAVYDPTPSPAETLTMDLPDANRIKGALGVGYTKGRLTVDAGYQFVLLQQNQSQYPSFKGTYNGRAHVLGITFGYRP